MPPARAKAPPPSTERQQHVGRGPCLHAALSSEVVIIDDMATDERWPQFADAARAAGFRASLSVPLPVAERVTGAINIYAPDAGVFDEDIAAIAEVFAEHAAIAVYNAQMFDRTAKLADRLQGAIEHRATIELAKGILMERDRITADEAFALLRTASQRLNVKLRDVAHRVVETGQHPDDLI